MKNIITLEDWSYIFNRQVNFEEGYAWVKDFTHDNNARKQLWNLKDYKVSSVQGGTIWLVKK